MSGTYQPSVLQNVGIGLEDTPGVPVPPTHRLGAMNLTPAVQLSTENFGPLGMKADTMVIVNQEWSQTSISGKPSYNEIVWPLSSIVGQVEPTQLEVEIAETGPVMDLLDVWDWEFDEDVFNVADPATFTVHVAGRNGYRERIPHVVLTDLGINLSRTTTDLTGTAIGHVFDTGGDGFDPLDLEMVDLVPILPRHINVYMDTSPENLGNTQLLEPYVANFSIGQRFNPDWPLRRDLPSFGGVIDLKPAVQLQLQMQRDATGMSPLSRLRNGQPLFIRIEAEGPVITTYTHTPTVGDPTEVEVRYRYRCDFCGVGTAPSDGDIQGNKTIQWTFVSIYNNDWGFPWRFSVRNKVPGLEAAVSASGS